MALQTGEPEAQPNNLDAADLDMSALADMSSVDMLVQLPTEMCALPFATGETVQVSIGRASDGVVWTDALVEAAGDSQVVLRIIAPLRQRQRRHDVRLVLDVPARRTLRLRTGAEGVPCRSRVLDISAGGMLLRTDCQLQTGERLVVGFTLPGDNRELGCALVVRYSRSVGESRFVWESGCQFQVLRPADRERIAHYIFAQQRDAAQRRKALEK